MALFHVSVMQHYLPLVPSYCSCRILKLDQVRRDTQQCGVKKRCQGVKKRCKKRWQKKVQKKVGAKKGVRSLFRAQSLI